MISGEAEACYDVFPRTETETGQTELQHFTLFQHAHTR